MTRKWQGICSMSGNYFVGLESPDERRVTYPNIRYDQQGLNRLQDRFRQLIEQDINTALGNYVVLEESPDTRYISAVLFMSDADQRHIIEQDINTAIEHLVAGKVAPRKVDDVAEAVVTAKRKIQEG